MTQPGREVDRYDVIVVGGGVVGGSTAFHLARLGAGRVALLERGAIGSGASGRSGALVRTHYTAAPEAQMALAALPWFEEWGERIGGDAGFNRTGFLQLVGPRDTPTLRENVAMLQGVGVMTELIDAPAIRKLAPYLNVAEDEVAAYEPRSGYANPVKTADAFAAAAERLGVEVRLETPVTRLVVEGGRVAGVETAAGPLAAEVIVLANGYWSVPLLHEVGVDLTMYPTNAQVAYFSRPPEVPAGSAGHLTLIDRRYGFYTRPEGDDATLIGLSGSHRPLDVATGRRPVDLDTFPRHNDPEFPELVRTQLAQRVPAYEGARYLRGHMGPIDVTEDHRAILGPAPGVEGLVLAVGMSGGGFKKSPAIGACVAELIVEGRATTAPIEPFRATRFAEGDPITGHEYTLPEDTIDWHEVDGLRGQPLIH